MLEPATTIVATVATSIGLTTTFLSGIDLIIGVCTKNTPASTLWLSVLLDLRLEVVHARDQLQHVQGEIDPMRVKQGPGADAANLKRKEVKLDELLLQLANQLKESESLFSSATDDYNQSGFFNQLHLATFGTQARKVVGPIQERVGELKAIRKRVHSARETIINTFVLHCYNHAGNRFPTLESLGGIRDQLAISFLWPEPFCHKLDTEGRLTSGLLRCNTSDVTLKELHDRIQKMAVNWVHEVRQGAKEAESTSPNTTLDVLEKCQIKMLTQLDEGIFCPIIDNDPLTTHRTIAIHGLCTVQDWNSILLGGGGGIVIALGGKMSSGKSSIINAMLGRSLLPTGSMSFPQWQCNH